MDTMDINTGILSELERRILPSWFCSWPCDFLDQCTRDPNFPFAVAEALFADAGIRIPYQRASFSAETVRDDSLFRIVRLAFPAAENKTLCRCAYAVWNKSRSSAEYHCVLQGQPDPVLPLSSGQESLLFSCSRKTEPFLPASGMFRRFPKVRHPLKTAWAACAGGRGNA